jgi:DNA helicase-2/ATP-dependent DNA helicase PcrA
MSVTHISSDTLLDDIEQHFRVSAGPGAGKTYWLVEHIKNVLHNSNRLAKSKKIACITYTNIAVETILSRLGTSAENVEVSTIHSFLYKHIVKPYLSFISNEYEFNINEMDGHDEVQTYSGKIIEWIENHPSSNQLTHPYNINQLTRLPNNLNALTNWLESVKYKINSVSNEIIFSNERSEGYYLDGDTRRYLNRNCLNILERDLIGYKKLYWHEGKLSHDDVLFFSYQLLSNFPFILSVLRAKFPYFFIDEFQDSNPIQVAILKLIGNEETIVGVIGDRAQSIYGFQGADPNQFHLFDLPNIIDYQISNNRRSSNEIINLLNILRNDIIQNPLRNHSSRQPTIIVGQMNIAFNRLQVVCGAEPIYTLSRQNIISNAMKIAIGGIGLNGKLFEELKKKDSNPRRHNFIISCIKSIEFARENKFKDSIKELEKIYKYLIDKQEIKKISLKTIILLLERYEEYKIGSLFEFAEIIRNNINNDISRVTGGGVKTFYDSHTYQQLALCVNVPEDLSRHKTIHKSKGDEFDNVLLVLKSESDLSFITNPNVNANEEHRINYVAVSRARNKLFISVPTLNQNNRTLLQTKVQIIDI